MRFEHDISLIGIISTLILSGLAIIFRESVVFAFTLIFIALLVAIITLIRYLLSKRVKIFHQSKYAAQYVEKIYKIVAQNGGEIHATHIFPREDSLIEYIDEKPIVKDIGLRELMESNKNSNIIFERILILDNPDIEKKWLKELFTRLNDNILENLWVLEKYPIVFTKISKKLLPRVNLLLVHTNRSYYTMIGLDQLFSQPEKTLSFVFRSPQIYELAQNYFSQITKFDEMISIKDLKEYTGRRFIESYKNGIHQSISEIVKYSEKNRADIAFIGLFGSIAKIEQGIYSNHLLKDEESDIDIMIVLTSKEDINKRKRIKTDIGKLLTSLDCEVVWGDDLNYFYEYRIENKVTIDIEIRSLNSQFYFANKLLSYSIFKYFIPLYSISNKPISEFLNVPTLPLNISDRRSIVLTDRKGLEDFNNYLSTNCDNTDPRRLLGLILKNMTWAESGCYPANTEIALSYLKPIWKKIGKQLAIEDMEKILSYNRFEAKAESTKIFNTIKSLLQSSIYYFKSELFL